MLVNNQTEDRIALQQAIEDESLALGMEKYREAIAAGEDTMPPGMRLIKVTVEPLTAAIKGFLAEALSGRPGRDVGVARFLDQFEPERAAFIVARKVIHQITEKIMLSTLASQVASLLEDCLNFDTLEKENPGLYKQLLRKIEYSNDEGHRHLVMRKQQEFAGGHVARGS